MKKPDEIKKALECCFMSAQCGDCPYYPVSCDRELVRDAREYIRQLEGRLENLICNFMDFVTDGVHNPAPYCEAASELCVDGRGWCQPGCVTCNGFVPKMEDNDENT